MTARNAPSVLVIDDDPSARSIIRKALASEGFGVAEVGDVDRAVAEVRRAAPDVVLLDLFLPEPRGIDLLKEIAGVPSPPFVIVVTGHAELSYVMEAMKWGAYEYIVKPFDIDHLRSVVREAVTAHSRIRGERPPSSKEPKQDGDLPSIVGESEPMRAVLKLAGRAAASEETVLITGESGVGKEIVAQLIHRHSARRDALFLSVNCAAIPAGLVEAELFGYERGAFTGADRNKSGKFAVAHRGTLFLDEVGDLPLEAQAKLLRVLQEREVTPLGTSRSQKIDTRVLCASNTNLRERVRTGRFREDLYYRLAVIEIHIPPLRERKEDILPLVRAFAEETLRRHNLRGGGFTPEATETLREYDFPGNVRELKNIVSKLIAVHREKMVTPDLLPPQVAPGRETLAAATGKGAVRASADRAAAAGHDEARAAGPSDWRAGLAGEVQRGLADGGKRIADTVKAQVEDILIREALQFTRGNQVRASELLGIHRNTLRRKRS